MNFREIKSRYWCIACFIDLFKRGFKPAQLIEKGGNNFDSPTEAEGNVNE